MKWIELWAKIEVIGFFIGLGIVGLYLLNVLIMIIIAKKKDNEKK